MSAARMVWVVMCEDGTRWAPEVDIDSIWDTSAEAHERMKQVTGARRKWVEGRRIGEPAMAYH